MAERRMFSKTVINSARFLRMPQTSRLLYYDLGMAADDDGIVEAFTVLRTTGAAEDDLRVLVSKGFVVVLNEDLVSYITDWKRNNLIKTDRYHESAYHELLVKIQDGTHLEPEVRLGKDRLGKDRLEGEADKPPTRSRFSPPTVDEVRSYCQERGNHVDPDRFVDFYASKGWRVGNQPMKDWKAAVRTWEKRDRDRAAGANVAHDKRDWRFEDL